MDQRTKLVRLLISSPYLDVLDKENWWLAADHLLSNGVIVPTVETDQICNQNGDLDEFVHRLNEKLYTIPTVYNAHFRKMIDTVVAEMKGGAE